MNNAEMQILNAKSSNLLQNPKDSWGTKFFMEKIRDN